MRSWTLAICLAAGTAWATQAEAGHGLFKHRSVAVAPMATAAPASTGCAACDSAQNGGAYAGGGAYGGTVGSAGGYAADGQPPIRPYSYYAAAPGQARGYYGYGQDEFPYYGRAYGHPYDPWTWPYMTGYYQNSLYRYYEPVLK